MIGFVARKRAGKRVVVEVRYDDPAHSFLVFPYSVDEAQSVLVGDLEIHTDADGRVLYVDGFAPRTRWVTLEAPPPAAREGEVHAVVPGPIVRGSSVQLIPPAEWSIGFNHASGWLCVGDPSPRRSAEATEIQPGIILVLDERRLVAIWLAVQPGQAGGG